MIGSGKLFETIPDNNQQAGNGIILRSGVAKGVRIVHDFGHPKPALVLDSKPIHIFNSSLKFSF